MKVEISSNLVFALQERCAKTIHHFMVNMHLRRSWGIWEDASRPCPHVPSQFDREELESIRALVRSIENPWDRRQFCLTIKFLLNKICAENGTHRRWQDYVASVRKAKAEHDARLQSI